MYKHRGLLIVIVAMILGMSGYLQVASGTNITSSTDGWTMFRHDQNHSGYTTDKCPNGSVELLWTYKTDNMVTSSPSVFNGCVFVGSWDGRVYCLNASNGKLVWRYTTGNEVGSSPAIYNNSVYIGSDGGNVFCIDIVTGKALWKATIGGLVRSSPAIVDNRVYIGSGDHDIFCLNASNGEVIWRYPTSCRAYSSPAVSEGIVYVAADDYFVYALNASTGDKVWTIHTGCTISSPNVYNGCVYIGSIDGYVLCLNASTGATVWEYQTDNAVSSSPTVAYGCIYVGAENSNVYCLNASNGNKIWQSPTRYWVCSSPVVADGNVYVGSEDYSIYCFDAFTGAKKWSYETENLVDSSPTIADGKLFFGSNDYHIYAFVLGNSADSLPTQTINSLHWTTIVFDAIACAVAVAIIFEVVYFIRSTRKAKQNVEETKISGQKQPWFSKHGDAVYISAILAFSTIFLVDLTSGPLWIADERIYSQWAFHMLKNGDYLTPWAFGNVSMWLAKPPLFMWLMSLSYQLFGINNFATRFWNPVFGTLSLVLIFYLGKELYNRHVGLFSALILGTFITFNVFARRAMTDVPFIFFVIGSIYFLLLSEKRENTNKYAALGGLFFGLAFMTKQIAALLIPLIIFTYFATTGRGIRFLFTERFNRFWQIGFMITTPWLIYMILSFGPVFWDNFFVYSGVNRITTVVEGHFGGYLYYFDFLASQENLLWVTLLPLAVGLCVFNSSVKRVKEDALILSWMTIVLVLFAFVQTKIVWYILPAYPAFAIAISSFLYQLAKKIQPFIRH